MNTFKQLLAAAAYLLALVATVIVLANLQGCTVVEEKTAIYKDVAAKFSVPDKVEACYRRDGEKIYGSEARCFGKDCVIPSVDCSQGDG